MVSSSGAASHLLATDPLSSPVLHRLLRDETAVSIRSLRAASPTRQKRSWGVIQHTRCARSKSGPRRSQSRLSLAETRPSAVSRGPARPAAPAPSAAHAPSAAKLYLFGPRLSHQPASH